MKMIRNILFTLAALTVLAGPVVAANAAATNTVTAKTSANLFHKKHHKKHHKK